MVRFRDREKAKEKFYAAKRPIKIWDVNVDNVVISKLVKTKTNSNSLMEYLDKAIRSLILIMPKMSGYVKTFKVKEGDNKLNVFPYRWWEAITGLWWQIYKNQNKNIWW